MEKTVLTAIPALPEGLPKIQLSDNSIKVLEKRYLRRGADGKPIETIDEMFWRVAYNIAVIDENYDGEALPRAEEFYRLMTTRKFFPNSPTFTGAGTPLGQLAACFVLPISDDMGKLSTGIFQTLRDAALIQQTGGGNGFSFSRIRPKDMIVRSSAGKATGPVGFLRVYDHAFNEVAQGGSRRGANMAVLRVDHPDVEEFITCKTSEQAITNFNLSIAMTDDFMRAVELDEDWDLVFPDLTAPDFPADFDGDVSDARAKGLPIRVFKTLKARELFDLIVTQAHHNGEPGVLFVDQANRENPIPNLYRLESTNPCGEQWLGPYENCCLGSINLAQHGKADGTVDWEMLRESVTIATHFLDNVIDANAYVPAVPQLREAAMTARRIGLGIMGLADLMYMNRIRYGSEEGQEFASQLIEFIRFHAMKESMRLARVRGAFKALAGSIYDPKNLKWTTPKPIMAYQIDFGRPPLDWGEIETELRSTGIRNAAQLTIAPTGTIATVIGCEGYGCEPVFALAYIRHMNDNGKDVLLTYASPQFDAALSEAGITGEKRESILNQVMSEGSCRSILELPEDVRNTFVVSADITAQEHIRMQAALQAFVDNSLSKTVNFPEGTTVEDVAEAYQMAWQLGCKGTTVYITGSRDKVVLETRSTLEKKTDGAAAPEALVPADNAAQAGAIVEEQMRLWQDIKKPRPRALHGFTYKTDTPIGKSFITINENGGDQPFEVFINTSKAGSETSAISEALGRLISYNLRMSSPLEPVRRLKDMAEQLHNIGGGRSLGFGPNRVRSLPDGLATTLLTYIRERKERTENGSVQSALAQQKAAESSDESQMTFPAFGSGEGYSTRIGDLCPECGEASVINEEGCRKCYSCGYSEC